MIAKNCKLQYELSVEANTTQKYSAKKLLVTVASKLSAKLFQAALLINIKCMSMELVSVSAVLERTSSSCIITSSLL